MQKNLKAIAALLLTVAMVCAAGCNKSDDPNSGGDNNGGGNDTLTVNVTTYMPEQVAQSSAVCGGELIVWDESVEIEELGVCWSKSSNPKVTDDYLSTTNWQEPFICILTDLDLDTKYYVRAYAKTGTGFCYGEVKTFTTLPMLNGPSIPSVFTLFVTDIHSNYAVGNGYVAGNGGLEVTERGFCWSSSTSNPTIANSHAANGSGLGQYAVAMTALTPNTTYYVCAYAINSEGVSYGMVFSFETNNDGGYDDLDWVDLGLPSGLLWATRNVGANSPEDFGDYFAWGEIQPKSYYNGETYKYYIEGGLKITKYNTDSYYGAVDNLTTLQPGDDVATANWGGGVCMPTKEEWEELDNNCTSVWMTQNGVSGRQFTGPNGNTLFLPAAGDRWWDGLFDGDGGFYWSSSLYTDDPYEAWYFGFSLNYTGMYYVYRSGGLSVRAVREN